MNFYDAVAEVTAVLATSLLYVVSSCCQALVNGENSFGFNCSN